MKNIYIYFCLLMTYTAIAQPARDSLRDRHWFVDGFQQLVFTNSGIINTTNPAIPKIKETNASICDTAGNLLFYSNGIFLFDRLHRRMPGAIDTLSPGFFAFFDRNNGYRNTQGIMILPNPTDPNIYHVYHTGADRFRIGTSVNTVRGKYLYETQVDMRLNNGFGASISRQVLWQDTLAMEVTATRHANGRDWWIIMSRYLGPRKQIFLLDGQGTRLVNDQYIGPSIESGLAQSCFSPTGDRFVDYNSVRAYEPQNLTIWDFDRCSGLLSNGVQCMINDTAASTGVAISPNGRWLYVSSHKYLYQYDLHAPDICASKYIAHTVDMSAQWPLPFYLCQLGPDGRIYISSQRPDSSLHYIEHPDLQCPACGVRASTYTVGASQQPGRAFQLASYNNFSLPNFPYFKLGALAGSGCDTLTSLTPSPKGERNGINVFPNPASDIVYLNISQELKEEARIEITDALGKVLASYPLPINAAGAWPLNTEELSPAMYFVRITDSYGTVLHTDKLVIVR